MKYKILKGTATYAKLEALWKRMQAAHLAARKLSIELGADEWVPHRAMAGGILAAKFKQQPDGWKKLGAKYPDLYEPKEKNKALRDRLKALPVVPQSELNSIVGFKPVDHIDENTGVWRRIACPGLVQRPGYFLLSTGDASYSKYTPPNADIVEILESEYQRLSQEKKTAKA